MMLMSAEGALSTASKKLLSPEGVDTEPYRLENLPTDPNANLWNRIETIYKLSVQELGALQNHVAEQQQQKKKQTTFIRPRWDQQSLREAAENRDRTSQIPTKNPDTTWFNRKAAEVKIQEFARSNFGGRTSNDHAAFSFLTATGHVRSGKTRVGMEMPRIVAKALTNVSPRKKKLIEVAPVVYINIDFLYKSKYVTFFDTDLIESEGLGARLIAGYFNTKDLKAIEASDAIRFIVEHEQQKFKAAPNNNTPIVVPIVLHFDEYGTFVEKKQKEQPERLDFGRDYFLSMLAEIGMVAMSDALGEIKRKGEFVIYPITTGTSAQDTNFDAVSNYSVKSIPLPVLDMKMSTELAREFMKNQGDGDHLGTIDTVQCQVALADTGGLPGLIGMVVEGGASRMLAYVSRLRENLSTYLQRANLSSRWPHLAPLCLARPKVSRDTVIVEGYTVGQAQDSGALLLKETDIGMAPALFAHFNESKESQHNYAHPVLLKQLSNAEDWTWQEFETAHIYYMAAVMSALNRESGRFSPHVVLGDLLRNAQPSAHASLQYPLHPKENYNILECKEEKQQSIQSIPKKKAKREHHVDVESLLQVVKAADGTPIIDAHMNLRVKNPSRALVLFLQYKHSKLSVDSVVKVSDMNKKAQELADVLQECQWGDTEWLFLWVSNRAIDLDEAPHAKLLWVGEGELELHAPLIARRGLVVPETVREEENAS